MDSQLADKVAVITGGTGSIGRTTAMHFLREGAKVAICARRATVLADTVEELKRAGGDVFGMAADVAKSQDVERFMHAVIAHFGRIDILVNMAGDGKRGAFLTVDDETWNADLAVKMFGVIRCVRLAIPHMRRQGGGRIINVSSIGGKQPFTESTPATVSRATGLALTKALSKEFAADNILVNIVCLGKIRSTQHERRADTLLAKPAVCGQRALALAPAPDRSANAVSRVHWVNSADSVDQNYAKAAAKFAIPIGRFGEADEVARVIVFLASGAASYVTGSSINVDGGLCSVL